MTYMEVSMEHTWEPVRHSNPLLVARTTTICHGPLSEMCCLPGITVPWNPIPVGRPFEPAAVDVLKLPKSRSGKQEFWMKRVEALKKAPATSAMTSRIEERVAAIEHRLEEETSDRTGHCSCAGQA